MIRRVGTCCVAFVERVCVDASTLRLGKDLEECNWLIAAGCSEGIGREESRYRYGDCVFFGQRRCADVGGCGGDLHYSIDRNHACDED